MDPFKEFTHGGTLDVAEILFNTRFDDASVDESSKNNQP